MTRGIVIGKFFPPHLGHSYLIGYALSRCDQLTVLICDSPRFTIPATKRQEWLQKMHPAATVRIIPDIEDDDNSKAWADHTVAFLGFAPDYVFSSEDYGTVYAPLMGAQHIMVDKARTHVPISATRVRANMFKEWDYLDPIVKADLAERIVVVGAESTGTTTLAESLAKKIDAPWVPEYGRLYSQAFLYTQHDWTDDEFEHIAKAQQELERQAAMRSHGIIICDTNAFATSVWQERYLGHTSDEVATVAKHDHADLYLLTGDEIPFVQDGTRDGEAIRHTMHARFSELLSQQPTPTVLLRGARKTRLNTALQAIETTMKHRDVTKLFQS